MTSEYEKKRQLNISKNKELLNGLSLQKPRRPRDLTKAQTRPAKRQKLDPPVPTRTSSRLSSQPKPTYVEEVLPQERATTIPKVRHIASEQKELTGNEVQAIIQRWTWETTTDPPTRDENGTLHFDDYPDVLSFPVILILVPS